MGYINRDLNVGYTCRVMLSAEIAHYPNVYGDADIVQAPKFTGFGITTVFLTDRYMSGFNIVHNNPRFEVYDVNGLVTTIYGNKAVLDIMVIPIDIVETVDFQFWQDMNTGEYLWRGLEKSNLPDTRMDIAYTSDSNYRGYVNGLLYSGATQGNMSLTRESNFIAIATGILPPSGAGGVFSGSASVMGNTDFEDNIYSYSISGNSVINGTNYSCQMLAEFRGNSVSLSGTNASAFNNPGIFADINSYPVRYRYLVSNAAGDISSLCEFSDINGKNWTGAKSPYFEYQGQQKILVSGSLSGFNPIYSPACNYSQNSLNGWSIDDEAPDYIGDINLLNSELMNDINIDNIKNTRVMMYPSLNSDGGNCKLELAQSVEIDDFSDGWDAINCSIFDGVISDVSANAKISKSFFRNNLYPGESGVIGDTLDMTKLLPHIPILGNLYLTGNLNDSIDITIKCGERSWKYRPVNISSKELLFDLTRPTGDCWELDTANTYYDNCSVEKRIGNGDCVYTDERPEQGSLYGASLFDEIIISGFTQGNILNGLGCKRTEDACFIVGDEFCNTRECGGGSDGGDEESQIERNRYITVLTNGRYAEIPHNQRDITKSGVETWVFPRLFELNRIGSEKLLFPRDDYKVFDCKASAFNGGSNPRVDDIFTESAYIGWLEQGCYTDGVIPIRPRCDSMTCAYFYLKDSDSVDCIMNIGANISGFVNAGGDRISVRDTSYFDDESLQDCVQYVSNRHGSESTLDYFCDSEIKNITQYSELLDGVVYRYAMRLLCGKSGKIWRDISGKILRGINILRGSDYE